MKLKASVKDKVSFNFKLCLSAVALGKRVMRESNDNPMKAPKSRSKTFNDVYFCSTIREYVSIRTIRKNNYKMSHWGQILWSKPED